jgi:hypothetical protein
LVPIELEGVVVALDAEREMGRDPGKVERET